MVPEHLEHFRQCLVRDRLAGAVVGRLTNVFYLTGYSAAGDRPSFVVVGQDTIVLLAPGDAAAVQHSLGPGLTIVGYDVPGSTLDRVADVHDLSARALGEALGAARLRGKTVGIEAAQRASFRYPRRGNAPG